MANRRYKVIGLLIVSLLQFHEIKAQVEQPTLLSFFEKLRTIVPVKESLHYDTFPDFDFTKFEPLQKSYGLKKISYVVGSTRDNKIRTVTFTNENGVVGTMSVYYFQSFKILTFKKLEVIVSQYPDFPIFCISNDSRFIVYLNKHFQYQQMYKPEDIASIQILRNDLFPVYALTIRDNYVRMLTEINYTNGQSKFIDKLSAVIVFQPEKDKRLLISGSSSFSEEDIYIPRADFIANSHPLRKGDEMPCWFYANTFDSE